MKLYTIKKSSFNKEFLRLNIPIFISQSFLVLIGILNSIIFGQLGSQVLASIAIVDKVNSIYWPILGAVSTVVSMYFIQNYEKNRKDEIKKIFILTMVIMSLLGLTSLLILIIYGKVIISSYNTNKELLKNAYIYLVAVGIANFFASLSFGIIAYINGIGKIKESSFIGVFSTFNSLVLYIIFIIFLKDSFLGGIIGLSISIILIKIIELLFYIYVYKTRYSLSIKKEKFKFNMELKKLKELFSLMVPLLFNNIVFMIMVNLIFICFSRKGIRKQLL